MNVEASVIKILSETAVKETIDVTPTACLTNSLGLDSLDRMEVLMNLEEEFDINIPLEVASEAKTVQDVISYIEGVIR